MWVLRHFWRSLGALTLLGGIFWAPKDAADWRDAAEPWRRLLAMADQTTALWVFAVAAAAYILWIDARPYLVPALRRRFPFVFRSGGRLSFVEFGRLARRKRWKLGNDSFESLDLVKGIRQAAADGLLKIDARLDCRVQDLAENYPLQTIPQEIFGDHWLDIPGFFAGEEVDNFHMTLWRPGQSARICANDLHFSDADEAKRWLARDAPKLKGRAEKDEAKRIAKQAADQLLREQQDTARETRQ